MADYTTNSVPVSMIVWNGSNVDAVVSFIGAPLVRYNYGALEVNSIPVAVGHSIAKSAGVFYGIFSPERVDEEFTEV